jgi:hypothetical protein
MIFFTIVPVKAVADGQDRIKAEIWLVLKLLKYSAVGGHRFAVIWPWEIKP